MTASRFPYAQRITEMRCALCQAITPLTLAEIAARCASTPTTVAVGCAMAAELREGRVTREGAAGTYRYRITELGRAAAANPNVLRRGRRRRSRAHRRSTLGHLLRDSLEGSTQ